MGGSTTNPSQSTTVQMSPQQKWLFGLAKPGIANWAAHTPQRYGGEQVAGFDPLQRKGQNMAVNTALGQQTDFVRDAARANDFLMGDIWNPSSNPNLRNAITAATRPITENYKETVLPGIRDEFSVAGQEFGGSRRGVAEGIAGGRYLDSVGDTASKLVQDQYGNNLAANQRAIAMAPQTAASLLQPAQTVSGVGDIRQKMEQALINEAVGGFNFDQNSRFLQSKDILNILSGLPGGTSTTTANSPQAPWWQQALGGATAGASLLGGMGGGGGASLSSLLPFLLI